MLRILLIGHGACWSSLLIRIRMSFPGAQIASTGSLSEGLSWIDHDRFDLVLTEIDQFGPLAVETLIGASHSHPGVRFAVMSNSDTREAVSATLAGDLHGYISRRQPDEDIVSAIKEMLSGRVHIPWSALAGDQILKLSPRQEQVLRLLALGMSNKEVARALHIAESTAKLHTAMLMRALGVRNRTEAAFKAGKLLAAVEAPDDARSLRPKEIHFV